MERLRRGITFGQLLVFLAAALPVLVGLRFAYSTVDLAYLIRAGEAMLDTHEVMRTDTFTFTVVGDAWLNQQWGAEIVLALLHRTGSWEALAAARIVLVALIFWLEFLACRAAGASYRAAGWLTLGALFVSIDGLTIRPQLFGVAFFALTLWIVSGRSRRPRLLWCIPVMVLVWANIHGSFVLAPLLLLLTWLGDRRRAGAGARTELGVALMCVAAAFVNPFGVRIWAYVANLTTDPEIRTLVEEWQLTRPTSLIGISFFVSVVVVIAIVALRRPRLGWPRLVALAVFFALGFQAVRGVMWWALAAPVLIADLFPERAGGRDEPARLNFAIAGVLTFLMVPLLPWFRPTYASDTTSFSATDGLLLHAPVTLSEAVAAEVQPGSRIFVEQIWSSWFELVLPDYPVFVDSRIELFPAEVWSEYGVVLSAGEGWDDVLDRWDVDVLAVSRQQSGLAAAIRDHAGWRPLHEDADGIVFIRVHPPPAREESG